MRQKSTLNTSIAIQVSIFKENCIRRNDCMLHLVFKDSVSINDQKARRAKQRLQKNYLQQSVCSTRRLTKIFEVIPKSSDDHSKTSETALHLRMIWYFLINVHYVAFCNESLQTKIFDLISLKKITTRNSGYPT